MFGLLLAAQLTTAAPAQIPDGTYTYKATLNGATVGTSTLTVKNDGSTTQINEKVTGQLSGSDASANATLVLGADLSPIAYQMNASQDGSPLKDGAKLANGTATVTDVHGRSAEIDLPSSAKHFVVADFGLFSGLLSLPAQMRAWNNAPVLVVVPELGRSGPLVPDAKAPAQRPAGVPPSDLALVFTGEAPFTIWYDPATNLPDFIDVTSQGLTVTRQR
jgi:hypothetical protein